MADSNLAYELSRFEARPARQREEEQTRIERVSRTKSAAKPARHISPIKAVLCMALVIAVTSALLYTRVQLTERISDVSRANAEYTELAAEGTRMNLELEGKVSPKNVQEYAGGELGMIKADSQNVEYIRLTQENKIVVPEDAGSGFWESVENFFSNLFS